MTRSYTEVDTRLVDHRDRLTALERQLAELDQESSTSYQRRARIQRHTRTNRSIARKVAQVTGRAILRRGKCDNPRCDKANHGTVIVERTDNTRFEICPIAYYLRHWLQALSEDNLRDFTDKHRMEDFLKWCEYGHQPGVENTQLLNGET